MRYLELDGRRISVVGLGCMQFGMPGWGYGRDFGPREAIAIVRRALELGVTVLDTAEMYGSGTSESVVGSALAGTDREVFVATKYLPLTPLPSVVVAHAERSRFRLARSVIDLYQMHFPNPAVPLRVQAEGLRRVLTGGISRYVGVSNYSLSRWRRLERSLGIPIISNQVRYNLLQHAPERDLIPYARQSNHLVLAYSPLAQGALGGRYGPGNSPSGIRRTNALFTDEGMRAAGPVVTTLREIAAGRGASPAQVAIAYLVAQPQVVALPGARSLAQLESNVAAADIELTADETLALRRAADLFQMSRLRAGAGMLRGLARSPRGRAA